MNRNIHDVTLVLHDNFPSRRVAFTQRRYHTYVPCKAVLHDRYTTPWLHVCHMLIKIGISNIHASHDPTCYSEVTQPNKLYHWQPEEQTELQSFH